MRIDKNFNVKELYTPLSVAKEEIWRRWNDKELKKKVEDFLGGDIPEFLKDEPRAVTTRQIATPNKEFSLFYKMASLVGLKPLSWEYHKDIFITTNRDKACLGRIGFLKCLNKKHEPVIFYKKIIDLTGVTENKQFNKIQTVWGENLIDFHHSLLNFLFPDVELFDASEWYKSKGKNAKEYYPFLLVLFIRNGILFENFNLNGYEKKFSINVVFPAFAKLFKLFKLKPLVVKIMTEKDVDNITLPCYPIKLLKFLENKKTSWKVI